MFDGTPNDFLPMIAGAFLAGWLVAKFGTFLSRRRRAKALDPRDHRIRSLAAECRVAKADADQGKVQIEALEKERRKVHVAVAESQRIQGEQMDIMATLRQDLKDSVKKTRELRLEVTDRAAENARAELKLREIETELEVSRASTDLIATGVLDYSMSSNTDDDAEPRAAKAVT